MTTAEVMAGAPPQPPTISHAQTNAVNCTPQSDISVRNAVNIMKMIKKDRASSLFTTMLFAGCIVALVYRLKMLDDRVTSILSSSIRKRGGSADIFDNISTGT